jgi:hypothetical protein
VEPDLSRIVILVRRSLSFEAAREIKEQLSGGQCVRGSFFSYRLSFTGLPVFVEEFKYLTTNF